MEIVKNHLKEGQYINTVTKKDKIFIHHTAGSHRPDWVIHGWNTDGQGRVATAYVIGGRDLKDKDNSFNGKIYEAFDDKYWAYSLGIKNGAIEKNIVAIEICNYGQLTLKNGKFYNYVGNEVPSNMVLDLGEGKEFRGYRYWHNYTDEQIVALKELILHISKKHGINLKLGMNEIMHAEQYSLNPYMEVAEMQKFLNEHGFTDYKLDQLTEDGLYGKSTASARDKCEKDPFDYQTAAYYGQPGLWTHTNVRTDKFDIYPHPKLVELIKSF